MSSTCRATIVVPTYRRRDSVRRLLQALARQSVPPHEFEVIVSIDGAEDGTREMVAGFPAPYALRGLWHPRLGRAGACNAALRLAQGRVVVILDDDMEPAADFLAAHLAAHTGKEPVGVLGAVPVLAESSLTPVARYVGRKFNQHLARLAQPDHVFTLRDFYTGNFSVRREVLDRVGFFDEDFKIYGSEDLELGVRLTQAGVRIVYEPQAVANQSYTKDLAALAKDNVAKGRTAVILATKHPAVGAESRLGTYGHYSRKWRLARAALVHLGILLPGTPNAVVALVGLLERALPAHYESYYNLLLDYCFWLGAQAETRERHVVRGNPHRIAGMSEAPR